MWIVLQVVQLPGDDQEAVPDDREAAGDHQQCPGEQAALGRYPGAHNGRAARIDSVRRQEDGDVENFARCGEF